MFVPYITKNFTVFSNAYGYIVISIFLILTGLFLWVITGQFNIPDSGYANVSSFI